MSDSLIWTLLGHLVCIAQWAAFILVDYAYLGRGRRFRHPCVWAALLALAVLTLSVLCGFGFFNIKSVVSNIIYLLAIVQMFNDQVVQGQASHFQAALEQQRAEALMESYTAQRRLTHEFTNHIAALDALLRQGDLTGAQEYLSSVSKVVAAGTTILDTHNPLLDSLLSRKYEEAAQQGVELYFDLCDLKDLPFCGTDLVIVISNLLDNAIRAAAQAKPPEVYLRARRNEEEYLISVRNRVQKDLELVDGELPRSTKAEPGHGMGLVNVREVLDRCRCEYTLSCRDRWFRFTCAVPTRKL